MIPVLTQASIETLQRDHELLRMLVSRQQGQLRGFQSQLSDVGETATAVASVSVVIPARSGTTPGGPVSAVKYKVQGGVLVADPTPIEVYSWVQSPSPDPADQPDSRLYIYISQDEGGTWWYHAVDCTPPPPAYAVLPDTGSGTTIPSDGTEVVYIT